MRLLVKFIPVLFVILCSYWAIAPFFHTGFFPIHDDAQVQRVFEMHKALADGMFPVRWVSDLGYGYGYPIFNFYAPFVYYVGGFISLLGIDALSATKIVMALGVVCSGTFMYLLAREFWGRAGGIISALLYVYAPYHAVDIFVRGDVAEFWAYAFIPLAFWGVYKVFKHLHQVANLKQENTKVKIQSSKIQLKIQREMWSWAIVGSLGYAGIIISHNLTAMMVTPFLFVWSVGLYLLLRSHDRKYRPYFVLLTLLLSIGLAAFYWLPTLTELKYTNVLSQIGGGADYHDHFVCLSQLWNSPWGFGGSTRGCVSDGLSFKIGKLHILVTLFSLLSLFIFWKKEKLKFSVIIFAVLSLLFSIFLMLPQSQFVWDAIPQMAFFQYPWRFLLMTAFFTSFISGSLVILIKAIPALSHSVKMWSVSGVTVLAALVIVVSNAKVFVPQVYVAKTVSDYTNRYNLTWVTSKISDEYMPKGFITPKAPNQIPKTKIDTQGKPAIVTKLQEKTHVISADIVATKQTDILINQAYFPGWHVFIDGKQSWFTYFNKGMLVTVPQGSHTIVLRFAQTPIEIIGNAISLASFLVLLLGIILLRKPLYEAK
jgi:hypothetical protein